MALFSLNEQNLDLGVKVGILEHYKPTKDVKRVYKELEKLKEHFKKKVTKITGKENTDEINSVLESSEEKRNELQEFLRGDFNARLLMVLQEVEKLNEQLCPGYIEYKQKLKKKE